MKETLEEVAENYAKSISSIKPLFRESTKKTFIEGVKWQKERSYSEEDMKQFAFQCVANFLSNNDNKVEMSLVEIILDRNSKKFEQFKKK